MKALPLRHDPIATSTRGPQQGGSGADGASLSAFGTLLADIDAETASATKTAVKAPVIAPSALKSQAAAPNPPTSVASEVQEPSDVASLVDRLMAHDAGGSTTPQPSRSSTVETGDADPTTALVASPDAPTLGIGLPGLSPTLPPGATKTNASTPSATVAETIPDPTAVGPGGQTVAGTTQSLVPVATGALTASLDAPMMEMRALLVGSQVAPAMITPMSRSLASAGEAGSARPVQASATAGNLDADAGEAKNDVDAPLATSEPTKATTSVAVDSSGTAHRQATIAGLGGSDMAAMLPAPQSRTSPMAAVIDAVASMAAQVPDDTTSASSGIALARTMTLQINPGNSGTVSIRMRLIGRGLDLKLSVSDPRTLGLISRERDTLSAALHDQSYTLDNLVIQGGDASASASGAPHETMQQLAGGAGSQSDADTGAQSRSSSGGSGARDKPDPRPQQDGDDRVASSALGAVFV